MTTTPSEQLKKDLATLKMNIDNLESLSVQEARTQYRKVALAVQPDKVDPDNLELRNSPLHFKKWETVTSEC